MNPIIEITNFEFPELDVYARLNESQLLHFNEPNPGIFIAESPKVIERALNAGYHPISFLIEKKEIGAQAEEIFSRWESVPVYTAEFEVLKQLTGFGLTRGMLCAMERLSLKSVEEVCKNARRIAVLENVVNPTNVGAIFRSAAALNMDAVLLTPACSDPLYRRAARVSMGTVFQVPWTFFDKKKVSWPDGGIQLLKEMGFQTAAMALTDDSVRIDDKIFIARRKHGVLGTEGRLAALPSQLDCPLNSNDAWCGFVRNVAAAASAVAFWQRNGKTDGC